VLLRELSNDSGRGRIWSPQPGVFASDLEGMMTHEFAEAYISVGNGVLEQSERAVGIHDWSNMTGYESGVRMKVTPWAMGVISRFDAIHVLSESSVVRMGVSVANIALGGLIKVHKDAEEFARIREHLLKHQPTD
jgi:hypothetical protein